MKKLTLALVPLAMSLLLGCSGDEPEESQKAPKAVKTQVKPKEAGKIPNETEAKVVCNKFNLVTKVTGSTLDLSVDTDLPDHTVVMVSVSRSYLEKGNPSRYSVDYFSERGNIGKWKSKHRISIASEKWKSALRAKQDEMSRLGLGFDVASISEKIDVSMVVPINQPDPRFGERNSKLTGKAVIMASKGGRTIAGKVVGPMYVVEDEIAIDYPLDSPPVEESASFKIIERKYLNDALILSVSMAQLDNAAQVAKELVERNNNEYMVRIYFYAPDTTQIGTDPALIRYEWTKHQGLVKDYDRRLPAPSNERDPILPKYQVLFKVRQMHNNRVFGEILVESLSRSNGPVMLESIARAICKQERFDDITLYNTRDAYEANMSAAYLKKHPDALKKGFLGTLKDDEFIAGTDLYPD